MLESQTGGAARRTTPPTCRSPLCAPGCSRAVRSQPHTLRLNLPPRLFFHSRPGRALLRLDGLRSGATAVRAHPLGLLRHEVDGAALLFHLGLRARGECSHLKGEVGGEVVCKLGLPTDEATEDGIQLFDLKRNSDWDTAPKAAASS